MSKNKYLGYKDIDFQMPYAKFYDENVAAMPDYVTQTLPQSPLPWGALSSLEQATNLAQTGYTKYEIGYTLESDGEQRVAALTKMPNVTPPMWAWLFGWHGCRDNRYKLWHPKAHVAAVWKDEKDDVAYIGRTSQIQEYIGKKLEKANIRFVSPSELGFNAIDFADEKNVVYICARIGMTSFPLDFGYLIHQIRATENGSEMRSRFFIGGKHIALRSDNFLAKGISKLLQKIYRLPEQQAIDLLRHCAEEMNHLAKILPDIYQENN
jgi:hypothetical protein